MGCQRRSTSCGGGVIGLACAWELARNGHEVTLVGPAPGRDGASWVAAGMLAPVTEAQFGESALTALLLEGAGRWPAFAAGARGGHRPRHRLRRRPGTLTVALEASDRARLDDLLAYQHSLGLDGAPPQRHASAAGLVPALSPTCVAGSRCPATTRSTTAPCSARCVDGLPPRRRDVRRRQRSAAVGRGPVARPGGRPPPRRRTASSWRPGRACRASPASRRAGCPRCARSRATSCASGRRRRLARAPACRGPCAAWSAAAPSTWCPGRDGSVVVGATVEERGPTPRCRPVPCTSCSSTPGPWCPPSTSSSCSRPPAGLRPATPDNTPRHRLDRARRRRRGHRSLPQRHPAGAAHRGGRGRPGGQLPVAPLTRRWRRLSRHGLRVNGEPCRGRPPGSTIADVVAALTGEAEPKGVAVAVDRCVVPRSEWASTPAGPARWSRS